MTIGPPGHSPRPSVLAAILRVAQGRKDGIMLFGGTTRAFLQSMAPLIALPFAVAGSTIAEGQVRRGLVDLLVSVCAVLISPIVSYELSRLWDREARWIRFAVAFNWCQLALSVVCMGLLLVLGTLFGGSPAGAEPGGAVAPLIMLSLGVVGYGVWLHWFIAREGLAISGGRAALLVGAVYACTIAVMIGRGLFLAERG